ncbi:hypothetical protein BJV82DRAFT_595526 [Fennellomyces sp. T-0311]|nr:hypothetical protein BJV82DRAFT_595526 [Fennellomyces sp. T-0311]
MPVVRERVHSMLIVFMHNVEKVGGMRVKQPNEHRVPLRAEDKHHEEDKKNEEQEEEERQIEQEHDRALRDMQAEEMRGQTASMSHYNNKNAGNFQGRTAGYNAAYQQRSMNH